VENAPRGPREVIVGDITYLPMQTGRWGYLASWQDKFTKRIVGWAVETRMTEALVIKAFEKAVAAGSVKAETIVHTDRGSQYASNNFRALLAANECRQSMSRRANCYDNAQAESFFSRYKTELLEGGVFEDVNQARSETFSYIEGYYNRVRRHSALGYKSPDEFESPVATSLHWGIDVHARFSGCRTQRALNPAPSFNPNVRGPLPTLPGYIIR
jgi:transposase InsO family protein